MVMVLWYSPLSVYTKGALCKNVSKTLYSLSVVHSWKALVVKITYEQTSKRTVFVDASSLKPV